MKNLFGIYKDEEKNNINQFLLREVSEEKIWEMQNFDKNIKPMQAKVEGPAWIKVTSFPCAILGFLFVISFANAKDGIEHAMQDRGYLFFIALAIMAYGIFGIIFTKIKASKAVNNEEVNNFLETGKEIINEAIEELKIPSDTIKMDAIFTRVKDNGDGNEKVVNMGLTPFFNIELHCFIENGSFCFSDIRKVFAIPLDCFKTIDEIKKNIMIPQWNKDEDINSEKYKPYKIKRNNYGLLFIKPYYSIKLEINNIEYEMLIPNYELENFKKLVPLEVRGN